MKKYLLMSLALMFAWPMNVRSEETAATEAVEKPVVKTHAKKKKAYTPPAKKSSTTSKSTAAKKAPAKSTASTATLPEKKDADNSLQAWLKDLKKRVGHSQAKQNQLIAVAAVRGEEQPDAPPLYWKGKSANEKVDKKELQDFDMAISKALDGDNATAQKQLTDFIAAYPKSAMLADAQLTLKKLQESQAN